MPKLIILGSSNAIPDQEHENTHMLLVGEERKVLIDGGNNPILRLEKVGVDINTLTDLILTHFHPDHVSGVPQLIMNMWLLGRRKPLNVYGLSHTLDRVQGLMGFYGWKEWPNFFPVVFYRLQEKELTSVLECDDFKIFASPVQHFIPTIGLRIEFQAAQKTVVYSCDTEPCAQVVRLAAGANVLIHEASGALPGHSSASQAGAEAREAEVGELYLIHYPTGRFATGDLVALAGQQFEGPVKLAEDFMSLDFD